MHAREARGMRGGGCEGGVEAGFHPSSLARAEARQRRMAHVVPVTLLLLAAGFLAVLITVGLGRRPREDNDHQIKLQPSNYSSGKSGNQQEVGPSTNHHGDSSLPSAMLTAPADNITDGNYLQWESKTGNAHCKGGFSYSDGSLVVPRKGTYRVYLQITYEGGGEACLIPMMKLTSTVLSIRDDYKHDIHLLSSVDTVTCSEQPWMKSLYTSGLFLLTANEILHVTSSHPDLIVKNEHQVFFGAELLSE